MRKTKSRWLTIAALAALTLGVSGCQGGLAHPSGTLQVVTTTGILADLASHVLGDYGSATALVPPGADPHSYEPSLRDVRRIAYADVAFSNYLLLEEQGLIRTIETNLPEGAQYVEVAERATKHGATYIPLVEDHSLNTVWLGLRVRGDGRGLGATKTSTVTVAATDVTYAPPPHQGVDESGSEPFLSAYLTGTFGQPEPYFVSQDGFDAASNFRGDTTSLPVNAHTHMSWSFTKPGIYRLSLAANLDHEVTVPLNQGSVAQTTVTFAVGMDPATLGAHQVVSKGHMDIAVDLDKKQFYLWGDRQDGKVGSTAYDPAETVVWVPDAALNQIPADPSYRFMGHPGTNAYVLAQAVLGKHVHGEIDPHLWLSVPNAQAYVKVIRDALSTADPAHATQFEENAAAYLAELNQLDAYVSDTINQIPPSARQLVTTHDGYGYLAAAYGLNVVGFVTPNPAIEPSAKDMVALTNTVNSLQVPAVFLEPNAAAHAGELRRVANSAGIAVCRIYADSFGPDVHSYVQLMSQNAQNLKRCLDPTNAPPPPFEPGRETPSVSSLMEASEKGSVSARFFVPNVNPPKK